jgi:hypothetical protein
LRFGSTFTLREILGGRTGESRLAPPLDARQHGLWIDFVLREEATERIRTKQALDELAQLFVVRFREGTVVGSGLSPPRMAVEESSCSRVNGIPRVVRPDATKQIR